MVSLLIIQRWDGTSKVPLHLLYSKFLAYLIDQVSRVAKHGNNNNTYNTLLLENFKPSHVLQKARLPRKKSIDWIEGPLQLPLVEHRKYCIWRILAPYFINVRHLSFEESHNRIHQWLYRCTYNKNR
jgi:hypothetical protein